MYQRKRHRIAAADLGQTLVALRSVALAVCILALAACGSSDPVPAWEPDYPRDLDHVRETVGSVFLPTYLPDGYRLVGASVNDNPILTRHPGRTFEASLGYANGFRGIDGELGGYFFIYQFPEGWAGSSTHIPDLQELTLEGLTVWRNIYIHQDIPEFPAFYLQVDGRWLWISVQGGLEASVDGAELARIAKSVKQFSEPVDWLTIDGVTERGHYENPIAALDNIVETKGSVYIPSYLSGLGLHSVWLSEDAGSVWLKFKSMGSLEGPHLGSALLMTLSHPTRHFDQVEVGDGVGYVFWGTSSSDVRLEFERDGHWFALEVSPAPDRAILDEVIKVALSLSPYTQS